MRKKLSSSIWCCQNWSAWKEPKRAQFSIKKAKCTQSRMSNYEIDFWLWIQILLIKNELNLPSLSSWLKFFFNHIGFWTMWVQTKKVQSKIPKSLIFELHKRNTPQKEAEKNPSTRFFRVTTSSTTEVSLEKGSQEGSGSHNCVIFSKANHRSRVDIPLAPLGYRELILLAKAKKARKRRRGKLWSPSPLLLQSGTKSL